jgi:hypothetical protein
MQATCTREPSWPEPYANRLLGHLLGQNPSDLVGRPGLDPGTYGLKVQVRAFQRVAVRRTASQNCRQKASPAWRMSSARRRRRDGRRIEPSCRCCDRFSNDLTESKPKGRKSDHDRSAEDSLRALRIGATRNVTTHSNKHTDQFLSQFIARCPGIVVDDVLFGYQSGQVIE